MNPLPKLNETNNDRVDYQVWGQFGEKGFCFFQRFLQNERKLDDRDATAKFMDFCSRHPDKQWQLRKVVTSEIRTEWLMHEGVYKMVIT